MNLEEFLSTWKLAFPDGMTSVPYQLEVRHPYIISFDKYC
jgi:hypothetical protein